MMMVKSKDRFDVCCGRHADCIGFWPSIASLFPQCPLKCSRGTEVQTPRYKQSNSTRWCFLVKLLQKCQCNDSDNKIWVLNNHISRSLLLPSRSAVLNETTLLLMSRVDVHCIVSCQLPKFASQNLHDRHSRPGLFIRAYIKVEIVKGFIIN